MNSVTLYKENINVANWDTEKIRNYLINELKCSILNINNSLTPDDQDVLIYPKGYFHNNKLKDKLVIGDSYFFNCENVNGEELIGNFECANFKEGYDWDTKCNKRSDDIPEGVSHDNMSDDPYSHCEYCEIFQDWLDKCSIVESIEINNSLMEILFYCMCEYKYSKILFTPFNFTLTDNVDFNIFNEKYYCYNNDSKVSVIHATEYIACIDLKKVMNAFDRTYNAYKKSIFEFSKTAEALKTYGLDNLPENYKEQVCAWLDENPDIKKQIYTED